MKESSRRIGVYSSRWEYFFYHVVILKVQTHAIVGNMNYKLLFIAMNILVLMEIVKQIAFMTLPFKSLEMPLRL